MTARNERIALLLAALAGAMILAWRWVGFQGGDDASYALAALDWIGAFPPIGMSHWALRDPLVIPMAGVIALLGRDPTWLGLINLAYYLAFLALHYLMLRRFFGVRAALIGLAIMLALPELPVQATYANADLPEMCAVIASFWLLMLARSRPDNTTAILLLAGVMAGIGFLLRETTVSLLLTFALLFLLSPGLPRARYLVMALGFLGVVALQTGYLAARTGDPLHRFRMSVGHDTIDRGSVAQTSQAAGQGLDKEGVLAVSPKAAPFVAVLVSQKYGLLFWAGLPALLWVGLRRRAFDAPARGVALLFAVLAGVSFAFVALASGILYVVPRYFIVPAVALSVPLTLAVDRLIAWRPLVGGTLLAGFLASCLPLLWLENVEPLWSESAIVAFARQSGETVHVTPQTAHRARILVHFADGAARLSPDPATPGALLAYQPEVIATCARRTDCRWRARADAYAPTPGSTLVHRIDAPRRGLFTWLGRLGLEAALPPDIWRKLEKPNNDILLYRVR